MQMIAEILSVGTELLMGQIANTDAQFISRRLGELGVTIYRHSTVGDNPARVREALQEALSRSDMVDYHRRAGAHGGRPDQGNGGGIFRAGNGAAPALAGRVEGLYGALRQKNDPQ